MPAPGRVPITSGAATIMLLGVLLTGASAASTPVVEWSFSEGRGPTTADSVGSLAGMLDGATWIPDGVSGSALHFGGGRVTVADDASLRAATMGVRLWVRGDPDDPPADGEVILEKGGKSCAGGAYALVVAGGQVALRYRETASPPGMRTLNVGVAQLPSLWDGAWHQIAFSNLDDQWGHVSMYQRGWSFGFSPALHAIDHSGLDAATLAIGGPAQPGCGSGFSGDIDEVAVYSRVLSRDELAAAEPTVQATVEIESVGALALDKTSSALVRISPVPLAPGTLSAWLVDSDGTEHGIGVVRFEGPWQIPGNGEVTVPLTPEIGGDFTLEIRWDPSLPQLGDSATREVSVARAATQASLSLSESDLFIENEPIDFAVRVSPGARVKPTGSVELYEQTADGPVLIDTQVAVSPVGSWEAWAEFILAPRPAGTYSFFARYLGDASFEPSDAPARSLAVSPALVTGTVLVNDGDAVTDDEYVTVALPATGAIAVQLSLDPNNLGQTYVPRAWEPTTTIRLVNLWDGQNQDGLKTVWVRWSDALSRWTDWDEASSDSIILDRGLESGTLTLNAGSAVTGSHDVTAAVPVAHPENVESVQLSNDGYTWKTFSYASSLPWTLASGDGQRTVQVRWVDALGRQSVGATDSILVDTQAPTVSGISARVLAGNAASTGAATQVGWVGFDSGAGVTSYDVQLRRDGGSWSAVARGISVQSVTRNLAPGHSYQFRVRATDLLGKRSGWELGAVLRVAAVQEKSALINYSGKWTQASGSAYWGGGTRYATSTGATATLTFTGLGATWIAPTGPTRGAARIYVDGTFVAQVDLWAASVHGPSAVFATSWSSAGTHTVRIETVGTTGHARIDADGFVILR